MEIESLMEGSSREVEELKRLREMVDIGYLDRIASAIDSMEKEMNSAKEESISMARKADEYRGELEKERERLEKLWDAYKKQEEELLGEGKKIEELEEKIGDYEEGKEELEREMEDFRKIKLDRGRLEELERNAIKWEEELDQMRDELEERKRERTKLEKEIEKLREYVPYKDRAGELERKVKELEPLRELAGYKEKYEEMEKKYGEERERLAKLYRIYEDINTKFKEARKKIMGWESWFERNREYVKRAEEAVSRFEIPEELVGEETL